MNKKFTHLSIKDRYIIYNMLIEGKSKLKIAIRLERALSTVTREISRNSDEYGYLYPRDAHEKAKKRKALHGFKIDKIEGLKEYIIEKLHNHWAPKVIAFKWSEGKPQSKSISAESIYEYIYAKQNKDLRLYELLPRKKKKRGAARKSRMKGTIKNRVSVHKRPEHINSRTTFGHFEADLFFNKGSMSANVLSLVERKSRMIFLVKHNAKKSSNIINSIQRTIARYAKSVTFDNGLEFAYHHLLQSQNIDTYFCDPGSPWQKGAIEKVNAQLRRYTPFSLNHTDVTQEKLDQHAQFINNIPRESLNFKTPREVFMEYFKIEESRVKPAKLAVEAKNNELFNQKILSVAFHL